MCYQTRMGQFLIRNLDDDIVAFHKHEARQQGVSLEQYLRTLLSDYAAAKHSANMKRFFAMSDYVMKSTRATPDAIESLLEQTKAERDERDSRVLGQP